MVPDADRLEGSSESYDARRRKTVVSHLGCRADRVCVRGDHGIRVVLTSGRSIAVRSQKRTGAPVSSILIVYWTWTVGRRAKALQEATDQRLTGNAASSLRNAVDLAEVVAVLDGKVDRDATPDVLPAQVPILQPTDERRRSGSHYTPRSLTERLCLRHYGQFWSA